MGNIREDYKVNPNELEPKKMPSPDSADFADEMLFYLEFIKEDDKKEIDKDER